VSMRAPKVDSRAEVNVAVNANQARLRMRSLVGPMCGEIERTADQIAAGTTDPAVRKAALRWKIDAVPALTAALFQPEPMTAALDTWVFFNQMADFFRTGVGREQLGDSAPVAVASCRRLEQEIADVFAAMTVSGDVSRVRAFAKSWAAAHPIRYAIPDRETALGRALEREVPGSWSTGEAVAEITTSIDDLNRKLDVYNEHLFRQARWEAELVAADLRLADVTPLAERSVQSVESLAAAFDRIAPGIERIAAVAERTPADVAAERKAAIDGLGAELTRMIAFLQQERIEALKQVTAERIAAIGEISQAVSEERKELERDVERVGLKLVDHAIWRLAQLFAAVLVALGVGTVGILVLVRKLFFTPSTRA
jgi:phosphoserine phosphatase